MSSGVTADITLQPSVRGLTFLSAAHALVLFALMLAMPDGEGMALVALLVGVSWLLTRRHPALGFGKQAIRRVVVHGDGRWQVDRGHGLTEAAVHPLSVIGGRVPVLRFRLADGARAVRILLGDECPEEQYRRLRAELASKRAMASTESS